MPARINWIRNFVAIMLLTEFIETPIRNISIRKEPNLLSRRQATKENLKQMDIGNDVQPVDPNSDASASTPTSINTMSSTPLSTPAPNTTLFSISNATKLLTNSNFVTWNPSTSTFLLNGNKFVPVGPNVYWLGYTEFYNYPPHIQTDEMFAVASAMAATVVRSHTLGFSSGQQITLRPSSNFLNQAAFEPIDYALSVASS